MFNCCFILVVCLKQHEQEEDSCTKEQIQYHEREAEQHPGKADMMARFLQGQTVDQFKEHLIPEQTLMIRKALNNITKNPPTSSTIEGTNLTDEPISGVDYVGLTKASNCLEIRMQERSGQLSWSKLLQDSNVRG